MCLTVDAKLERFPESNLPEVTMATIPLPVIVVMGVSGCGKSTIGALLSQRLAGPFRDGDDLHPEANIAKMKQGQPLNDDDRLPWLQSINGLLKT